MESVVRGTDTQRLAQAGQQICIQKVFELFPNICPRFLQSIAEQLAFDTQAVTSHILDLMEDGKIYPTKESRKQSKTKRKREPDEQNGGLAKRVRKAKRLYALGNRDMKSQLDQQDLVTCMIGGDFPFVPKRVIQKTLSENGFLLFQTYAALDEATQQKEESLSWKYKKTPTPQPVEYRKANIKNSIRSFDKSSEKVRQEVELMKELRAARFVQQDADLRRRKEFNEREDKRRNFHDGQSEGETKECECCFTDNAMSQMVRCNGHDAHFFCIQCARRNAEMQVGFCKHELNCWSREGCKAGYSRAERQRFLTEPLESALDRIEQDESLRRADLPDLVRCPFCPYAEEYPPVTVDKEFRCRKPGCMIISCRLCNSVTHIPKTCKEMAVEHGRDSRREVEEAMSEALIRTCNKCKTPFVKESGCNKMTCSKAGCSNVQCYVCSESCDYRHFNRTESGGKVGNCPLFEDSEKRHLEEVKNAEAVSRKKVLEKNPHLAPESLDFKISPDVRKDDDLRKERSAAIYQGRHRPYLHNR